MLKAECPRCGETYFGWALENPENQTCECGNRLEVLEAKGKDICECSPLLRKGLLRSCTDGLHSQTNYLVSLL